MATRSISRLQHRRGLKSDLPSNLHEGEIGWCLDTRELFIGNGDAYGANTQVLTQWTPIDDLVQHTYRGATGIPSAALPRSIGSKLDDTVSVRDYGAKGNGVDDDHAAIQAAIIDRYSKSVAEGHSSLSGYVTIWMPAGTYRITQPLKLYPYVRLQGDGSNRTRIVIDNAQANCVVQTVDSKGNTDINIGMDSAIIPTGIDLIDLWLDQPNVGGDIVRLQRTSAVRLDGVRLSGQTDINSVQIDTAAVRIQSLGSIISSSVFIIHDSEIYGTGHAVYADDPVHDIRVDLSNIHHCWHGVTFGANPVLGGPSRIRITNNSFSSIKSTGIACYGTNPGVISTGNTFDDVGASDSSNQIIWGAGTNGCASIGDQFGVSTVASVKDNNPGKNIIVGPQQVSISTYMPNLIGPLTLLDNHPTIPVEMTITYDTATFNNINIDYSLSRATSKRSGRLTILTDGIRAVLQDEFNTLGSDLGVTFGYRISAGKLTLTYITTNTGAAATMSYTETKWLA